MQYITAHHITAQHSTAQHSTAQHSTAQHNTAQHSTAQHITDRREIKCATFESKKNPRKGSNIHRSDIGTKRCICRPSTHTEDNAGDQIREGKKCRNEMKR
jgi:hypothetical protein